MHVFIIEASGYVGAGFGPDACSRDNPTSLALTQKLLGWTPTHPGLIEDLDHGDYIEQRLLAPASSALESSSPT